MKTFNKAAGFSLLALFTGIAAAVQHDGGGMMNGSMMYGGFMMLACIVFALLVFVILVLGILALIKYLRSGR